MAQAQLITLANFSGLLVESTDGRTGTPNGNIYFDQDADRIEIITAEELPQIDLGSGLEDNPLTNADGITLQALYGFERARRNTNLNLRFFRPGTRGAFQDAGAFQFRNGVKLAGNDRTKIRGSGWTEFAENGAIDRIYFGVRSLNFINADSQPYVQISASLSEADLQAAVPINAARTGPLDEAFQVFGSTANGDAEAGDFDNTGSVLVAKVRTFGQTQGEATSVGSGVSRLQAFSSGFGIGETPSPSSSFNPADVFGPAEIGPFSTIVFERFDAPQSQTGFNQGELLFTDIISNPNMASLAEVRARLDALMQLDEDIDQGSGAFLPRRADPLYTIDTQGRLVTRQGLFIENLPPADLQLVVQTSDDGQAGTYPFEPEIRITVTDAWVNDPNAWLQVMYLDGDGGADFETPGAVIVEDSSGNDLQFTPADVAGQPGSYFIARPYAYDTNNQAGLNPGENKPVIVLAEGDGGATADSTVFTITRDTIVPVTVAPQAETNI